MFFGLDFAIGFYLPLRRFFIDFHALQASKSEQVQWQVLQKSNFRLVSYRMCLGIDFGRILESGWKHFWVLISLLRATYKASLKSMVSKGGRRHAEDMPKTFANPPPPKIFDFEAQMRGIRESLTRLSSP